MWLFFVLTFTVFLFIADYFAYLYLKNKEKFFYSKKEEFDFYYHNWITETQFYSITPKIIGNKWFKKIKEMNTYAVPFIIEKLKNNNGLFLTHILDELYPDIKKKIIDNIGNKFVNAEQYAKMWIKELK